MVAKICHIYKSLSVLEQVCKFFEHFSQNLSREIRIHKVSTNSQSKGTPKKLDGEVQVLNPTFPHSNTCNISKSALFVIKKEISNARIWLENNPIFKETKFQWEQEDQTTKKLQDLLRPVSINYMYEHYLQINISTHPRKPSAHDSSWRSSDGRSLCEVTHEEFFRFALVRLNRLNLCLDRQNKTLSKNYNYCIHPCQKQYMQLEEPTGFYSAHPAKDSEFVYKSTLFFGVFVWYDEVVTRPRDIYPNGNLIKANMNKVIRMFRKGFAKNDNTEFHRFPYNLHIKQISQEKLRRILCMNKKLS